MGTGGAAEGSPPPFAGVKVQLPPASGLKPVMVAERYPGGHVSVAGSVAAAGSAGWGLEGPAQPLRRARGLRPCTREPSKPLSGSLELPLRETDSSRMNKTRQRESSTGV